MDSPVGIAWVELRAWRGGGGRGELLPHTPVVMALVVLVVLLVVGLVVVLVNVVENLGGK